MPREKRTFSNLANAIRPLGTAIKLLRKDRFILYNHHPDLLLPMIDKRSLDPAQRLNQAESYLNEERGKAPAGQLYAFQTLSFTSGLSTIGPLMHSQIDSVSEKDTEA